MSDLQQAAKPILIPLFSGTSHTLTIQEQETVAAWATMSLMVAEWIDPAQVVVPANERCHFMTTKRPPPNWKIWIARHARGNWDSHWLHRAMRISNFDVPHPLDPSVSLPNTQSSTFIIGELYIGAFSSEDQSVVKNFNFEPWTRNLLIPIWPEQQTTIFWPVSAISDGQAIQIAEYPLNLFNHIGRLFGV